MMIAASFLLFIFIVLVLYTTLHVTLPFARKFTSTLALTVLAVGLAVMTLSVIFAWVTGSKLQLGDPLATLMAPWTFFISTINRLLADVMNGRDLLISGGMLGSFAITLLSACAAGIIIGVSDNDFSFILKAGAVLLCIVIAVVGVLCFGGILYIVYVGFDRMFKDYFILGGFVLLAVTSLSAVILWIKEEIL